MILAHRISAMNSTVELLLPLISEMSKESQLPEVDWSKARRLDFQEMIRSRDGAAARLVSSEIEDGEDFVKEVSSDSTTLLLSQYLDIIKAQQTSRLTLSLSFSPTVPNRRLSKTTRASNQLSTSSDLGSELGASSRLRTKSCSSASSAIR